MKKKKIVIGVLIAGLMIVFVALIAVLLSLNSIVRAGVEKIGPRITGTDVRLADVDISPLSGRGSLKGIFIGNPDGFKSDSIFELGEVIVDLEPGSVLSDTIVVEEIVVLAPQITFEGSLSGSNIGALKKNIESFAGMDAPVEDAVPTEEEAPEPAEQPGPAKPGKKVIIDRFVLQNGEVTLAATMLQGKGVTIPLPDVELTGIGRKSNGVTAQEAAAQIFPAIYDAIIKAVASSDALLKDGIEALEDTAKEIEDKAKEVEDKVEAIGDAAKEDVSKVIDEVKGLKGLFNRK